jgi:hypothetical protein
MPAKQAFAWSNILASGFRVKTHSQCFISPTANFQNLIFFLNFELWKEKCEMQTDVSKRLFTHVPF